MGKRRPDRIRRCRALCGDRRDFSALSHPGNANETSERQVYMSYSEATLKYPELSQPIFDKIKADPVEYVRYKNYVSHMLFAFDEILSVYDTPEWRNSFNEALKYHVRYICEDTTPEFDRMYFRKCASS